MLLKENNASHILELKTNNANSDDTYHTEDSFHFVERRAVNGNKWLHTYLKAFRALKYILTYSRPWKALPALDNHLLPGCLEPVADKME